MSEAAPRLRSELGVVSSCPEIVDDARAREITEILHFTTVTGAVGILSSGSVMSRRALPSAKHLEHVYRPNAVNDQRERDAAWHDYVNLSVSRINIRMFDYSVREQLKYDASWVVLSFSIDILGAPGVVFTTTNNIYSGCSRSEGLVGFRRLFVPSITQWWNSTVTRSDSHPMNWPTDRQAEVLYPGDLALEHLQRIDVQNDVALDDVNGIRGALNIKVPARVEEVTFR